MKEQIESIRKPLSMVGHFLLAIRDGSIGGNPIPLTKEELIEKAIAQYNLAMENLLKLKE
jgi:hypothetical protein